MSNAWFRRALQSEFKTRESLHVQQTLWKTKNGADYSASEKRKHRKRFMLFFFLLHICRYTEKKTATGYCSWNIREHFTGHLNTAICSDSFHGIVRIDSCSSITVPPVLDGVNVAGGMKSRKAAAKWWLTIPHPGVRKMGIYFFFHRCLWHQNLL